MDINQVLKSTESTHIEFKEKINKSLFQTISAFANGEGGEINIGINDKKEVKGFKLNNEELTVLTNRIVNKLGIHPQIEHLKIKDKDILRILVNKSNLPISYEGKYYTRIGNTTREMQGEKLKAFFIKGANWDALTGDFDIDEIDIDTVKKFIKMAVHSGRLSVADEKENIRNILEKLKLINNNKLTNASIILFGKNPQKYLQRIPGTL